MGRQSRMKARRRAATFSVVSVGMLEVLSVGRGDLKIEIGASADDRARAQHLIQEMIRKGYTLFVETGDGPLRVTRFDPDQMVYIVAGTPDVTEPEAEPGGEPAAAKPAAKPRAGAKAAGGKRGRAPRAVPVAGSRTTAIGRSAGA